VESDAIALANEIGTNIRKSCQQLTKRSMVLSRSDSTLRGYYPQEVDPLVQSLGIDDGVHLIVPAFFEGGRYTVHDIHYVLEGNQLVPAAQTPFARDKVFGYTHSNLRDWVKEKTRGRTRPDQLKAISIEDIRLKSQTDLTQQINNLKPGDVCIINGASYSDLFRVALSLLQSDIEAICRTAASFVAALAAQPPKALLEASEFDLSKGGGGLVVVGSYVPMTTKQLNHLQSNTDIVTLEIDVNKLLNGSIVTPQEMAKMIDNHVMNGEHVTIFTSRELVSGSTASENLQIGEQVSDYLTSTVSHISKRPKFIISKGGITSSVVATDSLKVKRAIVLGQVLAGIPAWQLGPESRFEGLPYIVFPGNVGGEEALTEVVHKLS
jgi:uncharacterized protein YgbK (DUF1537 family)